MADNSSSNGRRPSSRSPIKCDSPLVVVVVGEEKPVFFFKGASPKGWPPPAESSPRGELKPNITSQRTDIGEELAAVDPERTCEVQAPRTPASGKCFHWIVQ